jgi:DNA-binding LacI/PurR family transcriptional regulator
VRLEEASDLNDAIARLERKDRPTAIVLYSEREAPELLQRLYHRRIRIPDDVSLLSPGHADILAWMTPPISTIKVPITAMVSKAVELLAGRINNTRSPGIERVIVPERLIIRQSTGPPPNSMH